MRKKEYNRLYKPMEGNSVGNIKKEIYLSSHKCHNAMRYNQYHTGCDIVWGNKKKGILRGGNKIKMI